MVGFVPRPVFDLSGTGPAGDPFTVRVVGVAGRTLLAFLSVDCLGCEEFWRALRAPRGLGLGPGVATVVVTKGPASVSPDDVATASEGLAGAPVVMSDRVWTDYQVLGYPFFVLVDGPSGTVVGETVGMGLDDVAGMVASAPSGPTP